MLTKESAAALGVPLGTTTYAVQMQELARKSSGKSGRGGGPGLSNDGNDNTLPTYGYVKQKAESLSRTNLSPYMSSSAARKTIGNKVNDYLDQEVKRGSITRAEKDLIKQGLGIK